MPNSFFSLNMYHRMQYLYYKNWFLGLNTYLTQNSPASVMHTKHGDTLPGADKSLARPGRKRAAPVKSVMGRGMDYFG